MAPWASTSAAPRPSTPCSRWRRRADAKTWRLVAVKARLFPSSVGYVSFVRELVSEHREPAFRNGSSGFVLDDVPMLGEDAVLQAHDVHHDPIRRSRAEAGKTTMQHQEVSIRQNQLILVPHRRGSVSHQLEQSFSSWRNVVAVHDGAISVVLVVVQCVTASCASRGSSARNEVESCADWATTLPWCAAMTCWTMYRPSPNPPSRPFSCCEVRNGSNRRSTIPGGMVPALVTTRLTVSPRVPSRLTRMGSFAPCCRAFPIRFDTTCESRSGSQTPRRSPSAVTSTLRS